MILSISLRKSLFVVCVLHLLSAALLSAPYSLVDVDAEHYRRHYNQLSSVEESDRLLKEKASQFAYVLQEAEKIVVKYEMEGWIGLRLIHKHFFVGENQVMVEQPEELQGTLSLVTGAQDIDEAKAKKALPASWLFTGHRPEERLVFETSTDSSVREGIQRLQEKPQFVEEVQELLIGTRFHSLLSLALLKRGSLVAEEDEIYLEINSGELSKSILQVWNRTQAPLNTIQTSWSFKGPKQHACLSISGCVPLGKNGHMSGYYHQRVPGFYHHETVATDAQGRSMAKAKKEQKNV